MEQEEEEATEVTGGVDSEEIEVETGVVAAVVVAEGVDTPHKPTLASLDTINKVSNLGTPEFNSFNRDSSPDMDKDTNLLNHTNSRRLSNSTNNTR